VPLDEIFDKQGAALCHNLALDYSRNYRIAREMSAAEEFVVPDGIFGMGDTFFVDIDLVYEKHWLAMRKIFFKFVSVHKNLD
jgi:hypothetical protein